MRRKAAVQKIRPSLDKDLAMPYEVNNKDKRGDEVNRSGYMKKYIAHIFLLNN
jgi:hypothetical protein